MKTLSRTFFPVVIFILLAVWPVIAQERAASDGLREKIVQLEKADLATKSPSVQDIYRRSLLRLYNQLNSSVLSDITDLKNIQSKVGRANTGLQNEVAKQIQELEKEQNEISGKIQMLRSDLQASASSNISAPGSQPQMPTPDTASTASNPPRDNSLFRALTTRRASDSPFKADGKGLTLSHSASAVAACYADAPELVISNVQLVATDVVAKKSSTPLSALYNSIFFYTVADAVSSEAVLRNIKAYRYMGETARTDKQMGASPKSEGSTSAIEKPGFADLLGWAVEHGAIQQDVNNTTLTLSSSPYALIAAAKGDSEETYEDYEFLNRIGISANFNISDQSSVLTSARRKQLNEWSVRVRLLGDRSTRGQDFVDFWTKNIKDKVQRRLVVITKALTDIDEDPTLSALRDTVRVDIKTKIDAVATTATEDDIKNIILCGLEEQVRDKVKPGGPVIVNTNLRTKINSELVPELAAAHEGLEAARKELETYLDSISTKPEGTLAYTNHRTTTGSDYSEFKLLYEQKTFNPMKLVFNAGVSLFHRPDRTMNQQSVRDFSFALSFEGKSRSPFVTNELDMSNITYAFTGNYERMMENRNMPGRKADIAVAQFKLEIPLLMGMSIPISVSYANATETANKNHVRTNFGFNFDANKLFALRQLANLALGK